MASRLQNVFGKLDFQSPKLIFLQIHRRCKCTIYVVTHSKKLVYLQSGIRNTESGKSEITVYLTIAALFYNLFMYFAETKENILFKSIVFKKSDSLQRQLFKNGIVLLTKVDN